VPTLLLSTEKVTASHRSRDRYVYLLTELPEGGRAVQGTSGCRGGYGSGP
jgi:hypothetical protein